MFNWDNKSFTEILDLYGGNLFMAELDYSAMGFTHKQWAELIKSALEARLISPTVAMVMIERVSVR